MEKLNLGKIGVLMGGPSAEREISLRSGKAVCDSLKQAGVSVLAIDIKTDNPLTTIKQLKSSHIALAFIALHGHFGEDGEIQKLLEGLNTPYTGSGVVASRLALDKVAARKIFQIYGLSVPRYTMIRKEAFNFKKSGFFNQKTSTFPLVIKPVSQGSSIGLSIVWDRRQLTKAIRAAFLVDRRIILEEYIKGREITVGILEEKPLPIIEIIPKKQFFDYEAKYQVGMTEYRVPARLKNGLVAKVQTAALKAHRSLGCKDFSRVDMILKGDTPFVLEVNTIPGLTRTSLLPKAAAVVGISFSDLCIKLIKSAYKHADKYRCQKPKTKVSHGFSKT